LLLPVPVKNHLLWYQLHLLGAFASRSHVATYTGTGQKPPALVPTSPLGLQKFQYRIHVVLHSCMGHLLFKTYCWMMYRQQVTATDKLFSTEMLYMLALQFVSLFALWYRKK